MDRRQLFAFGLGCALAQLPRSAAGQAYPSRPIRLVVPYGAGGSTDSVARALASGLSRRLGQQVVVENKPGGNTVIATQFVAASPPDGHTLYVTFTTPYSMLPSLYRKPLPYRPEQDYTPIALLAELRLGLLVNAASPYKSLQEYIAAAKRSPGKLTYASTGTAQITSLAMELLREELNVDVLHVPFQGAAPALQALVGGQVDAAMLDVSSAIQQVKAGRLRALAVLGGSRMASLPEAPTLLEAGYPNVRVPAAWMGVVGPGGVPPAIVRQLHEAIQQELQGPEMQRVLQAMSADVLQGTPAQFDQRIKEDMQVWGNLIRKLGLQIE